VLDKAEYDAYLRTQQEIDEAVFADTTDSNCDGISDAVTKLMCDGVIRTGTGALIFDTSTYEEVQANDDLDGDGIKNGDEVSFREVSIVPEDAWEFEGHYYKRFDDTMMTWEKARSFCEYQGGYLATITSSEENAIVRALIGEGGRNLYWLGGYESSIEGDWHWVTAEPFDYTNWGTGEPNNSGNEGYMEMYNYDENGRNPGEWNDMKNDGDSSGFYTLEYTGFVCEWSSEEMDVFLNSSPACNDTDLDGFTDNVDPTPAKAEVFKSMTDYKKYYYEDEITVTFYARQPLWGSRRCIEFDKEIGAKKSFTPYHQAGRVGHSFIGIDDTYEAKYYFGFYYDDKENIYNDFINDLIYDPINNFRISVLQQSVPSEIKGDLSYVEYTDNGFNVQHYASDKEGDPVFSVAKTFVIDEAQLELLKAYKEEHSDTEYHIAEFNCTTFATEALKEIGLDLRVYEHHWTHDDPLYAEIAKTYYGYSPADAAEDIKENYDEYVACRTYELADRSLVIGYEVINNAAET